MLLMPGLGQTDEDGREHGEYVCLDEAYQYVNHQHEY